MTTGKLSSGWQVIIAQISSLIAPQYRKWACSKGLHAASLVGAVAVSRRVPIIVIISRHGQMCGFHIIPAMIRMEFADTKTTV